MRPLVHALRVIGILPVAPPARAASRTIPPQSTTLAPDGRASTAATARGASRSRGLRRGPDGRRRAATATRRVEPGADKGHGLGAVDGHVLLVVVRVVSVAAVGVLRVAVELNLARVGADEAGWAGGKLSPVSL
jgi:hypothetical protein